VISERYSNIDQLRFIAAFSVAITHLIISRNGYNLNLEIISSISVEVFFVISGFVLAPQILKVFESKKFYTYKIFLIRRWYRTIPLYILSLVLTSLILNRFLTFDFFKYLFFIQNFLKISVVNDYFSISWSLAVEEWFYILFPLFLLIFATFFKNTKNKVLNISILFIFIIFLIRIIFAEYSEWGSNIRRVVLYRLDSIAYGFILFFFKDKIKKIKFNKILAIMIFSLSTISVFKILEYNAIDDNYLYKVLFHFMVAIWGATVVLIFYIFDKEIKNKKYIKINLFLGKISYSIYLFHLLIIYMVSSIKLSLIYIIFIFFVIQISISTLLYFYFEEPILKSRPHYND
tara:strand:- start:462 stop:1499 length:1038 start_codon:yes stop_codon:yes gene_type:complete